MSESVSLQDLPPLAREIAECIGVEATLALSREYGGQMYKVPKNPRPGSRLVNAIGMEAAQKFGYFFGGEQINIFNAKIVMTLKRREEVLALVRSGQINKTEAATRLGMTTRWVRHLVNRSKTEQTP